MPLDQANDATVHALRAIGSKVTPDPVNRGTLRGKMGLLSSFPRAEVLVQVVEVHPHTSRIVLLNGSPELFKRLKMKMLRVRTQPAGEQEASPFPHSRRLDFSPAQLGSAKRSLLWSYVIAIPLTVVGAFAFSRDSGEITALLGLPIAATCGWYYAMRWEVPDQRRRTWFGLVREYDPLDYDPNKDPYNEGERADKSIDWSLLAARIFLPIPFAIFSQAGKLVIGAVLSAFLFGLVLTLLNDILRPDFPYE